MLVTSHVLSGAMIGAAVRRPVPAFLLGVASHFAASALMLLRAGAKRRVSGR